ncbi:MAG TPA: hypothetical protein VN285_09535 [Candidatus Deferrimicrobium sp.]|nr:hypothetical protein [Candidatus Deferrimicrobium sp.]
MVEGTVTKGSKGDTTVFVIVFDPQPDYEIFRIKATGPATIAGAKAVTKCYYEPDRVPSLTSYGLIVLLGLLILSGVYVIYNRRKGVSRA